jgi:hypothetical protein
MRKILLGILMGITLFSVSADTMQIRFSWDASLNWQYQPLFRVGESGELLNQNQLPEGWLVSQDYFTGDTENILLISLDLPQNVSLEVFLEKSNQNNLEWMEIDWLDFVKVELSWPDEGFMKITPGYGFGSLWYVGSYFSGEEKFYLFDTIFPDRSVVTVAVFDAISGMGLFEAMLEVQGDQGESLGSYYPNEKGVLVFFPDPKARKFKLMRTGYITLEGQFPETVGKTPLRMSLPMSPPIPEENHRIIYSWGAFPQDVDGQLTLLFDEKNENPPLNVNLEPKGRRFFRNAAIFDRDGSLGFDAEVVTIDARQIESFELALSSVDQNFGLGDIQLWHYFGDELLGYINFRDEKKPEMVALFWPK